MKPRGGCTVIEGGGGQKFLSATDSMAGLRYAAMGGALKYGYPAHTLVEVWAGSRYPLVGTVPCALPRWGVGAWNG